MIEISFDIIIKFYYISKRILFKEISNFTKKAITSGGCGIRTHGGLLDPHGLANRCFGPLSQPSNIFNYTKVI